MRRVEQRLHKSIAEHLTVRAAPGVFWFHVPNGGGRSPIEGAILKSLGVKAGVPDIIAISGGQAYGLELKAPDGTVSKEQVAVLQDMQAAGATIAVAYGIDQSLAKLEEWGLLRGKAS